MYYFRHGNPGVGFDHSDTISEVRSRVEGPWLEAEQALVRLARGESALKLRVGELLDALFLRGGHHELGFSSFDAYVVERCQRSAAWGRETRGLARRVRERSLVELRAAVLSGELGTAMAEVLARHATTETEASLLGRAKTSTVRALAAELSGKPVKGGVDDEPRPEKLTSVEWVRPADLAAVTASRMLVEYLTNGARGDEAFVEALLGEGETALLSIAEKQRARGDRDDQTSAESVEARLARAMSAFTVGGEVGLGAPRVTAGSEEQTAKGTDAARGGAKRRGATEAGTHIDGAELEGAQLDGAQVDGAQIVGANFDDASFDDANFDGANFDGANFGGANFDGAQIEGANVDGANFDGAQIEGANVDGAGVDGANFDGGNDVGANVEGVEGTDIEGANIGGSARRRRARRGPVNFTARWGRSDWGSGRGPLRGFGGRSRAASSRAPLDEVTALAKTWLAELAEEAPLPSTVRGLDQAIVDRCRALSRRSLVLARLLDDIARSGIWRVLGFKDVASWARERLEMSRSSLEHRATLVRRLDASPALARAVEAGDVGYESALLVSRVVGRGTEAAVAEAWVDRAKRRTFKHLREEVRAVELARAYDPEVSPEPPSEEDLEAVAAFERKVQSGQVVRPYALASVEPTQTSVDLQTPEEASRGVRPLRLRMSVDLFADWRRVEAEYRDLGGPPQTFVGFLCATLWETWLPFLETWDDKWKDTFRRDLHRCTSPVCDRHDVTAHHVQFRAHGGDDAPENLTSGCAFCHLEGIHRGRLKAEGRASKLTWTIGRDPILRVRGREKVDLGAVATATSH